VTRERSGRPGSKPSGDAKPICERKKRAAEALSYNALVQSWPEIARLAGEGGKPVIEQGGLFAGGT
jgi:hypothetical protein